MNKGEGIDALMKALPEVDGLKPVLLYPMFGCFGGVRYPYRKSPDMYMIMNSHPVCCCQCGESFPVEDLLDHIHLHDRIIKRRRAVVTPTKDGTLILIKALASKGDGAQPGELLCGVWGRCQPIKDDCLG